MKKDVMNVFLEKKEDYSGRIKKLIYDERIKNDKEVLNRYKQVKDNFPEIKYTYLDLKRYQGNNLIVDLQYYNKLFMSNLKEEKLNDRIIKMYFDFTTRLLDKAKYESNGYKEFYVLINVTKEALEIKPNTDVFDFKENLNIFSVLRRFLTLNAQLVIDEFSQYKFLFVGDNGYFTIDFSKDYNVKDFTKFKVSVNRLLSGEDIPLDSTEAKDSKKAIVRNIVDSIENNTDVKVNNLTGSKSSNKEKIDRMNDKNIKIHSSSDETETPEKKLVDTIEDHAGDSVQQTIDQLNDTNIVSIVSDIENDTNTGVKISAARKARTSALNDKFLAKKYDGRTINDLILGYGADRTIETTSLDIDTVNEEWKELKYINFNKAYDLDSHIVNILYSLSSPNKSMKVSILDIDRIDSSTTEDYIMTYTVKCEDELGKRFTLKFDVPIIKNDRFMRLRGNEKALAGQLVLLPISKTAPDTAQMVSDYNKIFITRYGSSKGKSNQLTDILVKTLSKENIRKIVKVTEGDNHINNAKYDLPIDYVDLSSIYTRVETSSYILYLDQDEIREKYKDKIDLNKGIPFGYYKKDNKIIYHTGSGTTFSASFMYALTEDHPKIEETLNEVTMANKFTYSRASILNADIPVILILGYGLGLTEAMKRAGIQYEISEKRKKNGYFWGSIKFKDGYIYYEVTPESSMLMNGLKDTNISEYSLTQMDDKRTYLELLDKFGGRLISDGLENFADLMVDPTTISVCTKYNLPTDYYDQLIYASNLLTDTKYIPHTDISGNRYRTNEILGGYAYKVISKSYGDYRNKQRHSNQPSAMTMKQSAIIDAILLDPTAADLSTLNPLLEVETANSVTFKGLSGMNSDRSYGLDKRTYDKSMINVLALSTNTAANVGINRQATLNMNIASDKGYIVESGPDEMNDANTFCATEALVPFGATRDDPFRSGMTFTQTAKHQMRVKTAHPSLITNGADAALAYMVSDTFVYKAKGKSTVKEYVPDEYIILSDSDGSNYYVDLKEKIHKNSDGGFYLATKLVPAKNIKVGTTFKDTEIIAYDPTAFSTEFGKDDELNYNVGTLCKIALMATDKGYEDSTAISEWLSDALTSEVIDIAGNGGIVLPKSTNILNIVTPGTPLQEGDPLIVFQNSFDEEEANLLLKNITDDEDLISDLGKITVKSKYTGVVQNIKVYRTVEIAELSSSLKTLVNKYEGNAKKIVKKLKDYNISDPNAAQSVDMLEATGKLKNAQDAVLVEIYIKYTDKMSVGDKLVADSACKGVVKEIYPLGNEPTSIDRPNEAIHAVFSNRSFTARMVNGPLISGVICRGNIELDRAVKEIMGIPVDDTII